MIAAHPSRDQPTLRARLAATHHNPPHWRGHHGLPHPLNSPLISPAVQLARVTVPDQSTCDCTFHSSCEPLAWQLYFGLPSNVQQEGVIQTLQTHGCAVLVGPPGTGKSQTIANVICHYLATGRRVLVTSKGEPATEVLRQKLPQVRRRGVLRRRCSEDANGGDGGDEYEMMIMAMLMAAMAVVTAQTMVAK